MKRLFGSKLFVNLIVVLLAISMIGCQGVMDTSAPADNVIVPIQVGHTMWGVARAYAEKSGTVMFVKEQAALFAWSCKDYWCFAGINGGKPFSDISQIGGGNLVNAKTMGDLSSWLKENGWEVATKSQIPGVVVAYIEAASLALANSWTTFLIVPAGMLYPSDDVLQGRWE